MKKTIAFLFAALFAFNVLAGMNPQQAYDYIDTGLQDKTEKQLADFKREVSHDVWKQYAEYIVKSCEASNGISHIQIDHFERAGFFYWCVEKLTKEECAALDARLAVIPNKEPKDGFMKDRLSQEYAFFPKTFEAWVKVGVVNWSPARLNLVRRYTLPHGTGGIDLEAAKLNLIIYDFKLDSVGLQLRARNVFVPATRMRLRARGEGFVVRRDGFNPLKGVLEQVTEAINAPKQKGLKELIEDYVPGYTWIEPPYPNDMQLMVLVGDILNGKVDVTLNKGVLFYTLGAEQYNEFVRTYNGRQ